MGDGVGRKEFKRWLSPLLPLNLRWKMFVFLNCKGIFFTKEK
jgi:hypothetical protein